MQHFLQALLAIAASVALAVYGKPNALPAQHTSIAGQQNIVAKTSEPTETPTPTPGLSTNSIIDGDITTPVNTTKIAAQNTNSGNIMPTTLPKVAIQHSESLEEETVTPTGTPAATVQTREEVNENTTTEQENSHLHVGIHANGNAFGQTTASLAHEQND